MSSANHKVAISADESPKRPLTPETGPVFVIIPCYNQAHFLHEAIQSALAQTYSHREILVIDDGMRARGADYLLLPATAFWWLDHYQKFGEYLVARYR